MRLLPSLLVLLAAVTQQTTAQGPVVKQPVMAMQPATPSLESYLSASTAQGLLDEITRLNTQQPVVVGRPAGPPLYALRDVVDAAFLQAFKEPHACASGSDMGVFSFPFANRCMATLKLGQKTAVMNRPALHKRDLPICQFTDVRCVDRERAATTVAELDQKISALIAPLISGTEQIFPPSLHMYAPAAVVQAWWKGKGKTTEVCTPTSIPMGYEGDHYLVEYAYESPFHYPAVQITCMV